MVSFTSIIFIGSATGESGGVLQRVLRDFHVEWPLLAAQTLNFCVVAYLLYRFAFKPLLAVVGERQRKITDGLQYAEDMRQQLGLVEASRDKTLKEATNEARDIVGAAQKNAEAITRLEHEKLTREMEEAHVRELECIRDERAAMIDASQREVAQIAVELARKILAEPNHKDGRKSFTGRACEEIMQ
ncbi:MAG: F0F1 ATP synthase subunit B [Puniceicoccales bacterium]|jgi:F-type H+-transporting ATPase subunit b|nr:F0F1 ATP synthase subunit B [Puniceicoccales bacterium]